MTVFKSKDHRVFFKRRGLLLKMIIIHCFVYLYYLSDEPNLIIREFRNIIAFCLTDRMEFRKNDHNCQIKKQKQTTRFTGLWTTNL